MTEESTDANPEQEAPVLAPGLAKALAPVEESHSEGRGKRRGGPDPLAALRAWQPRTRLGWMVMSGQILT